MNTGKGGFLNRKNNKKKPSKRGPGADDEARTRYLHLGKVALYQMSYIRICKRIISNTARIVKGNLIKCNFAFGLKRFDIILLI